MLPENKANNAAGLLLENSRINKPKIVVRLSNYIVAPAQSPSMPKQPKAALLHQETSLEEAPLKHNFRSLNTPENTVIDMSHFYTANDIKHNNIVLNHNYNSINYLNTVDENVTPVLSNISTTNQSPNYSFSPRKAHDETKQAVLQTKNLNFPVKIRPEYEIYQMDDKTFKRQMKIQRSNSKKNGTPLGYSRCVSSFVSNKIK